jgi:chromosome partitioning protein
MGNIVDAMDQLGGWVNSVEDFRQAVAAPVREESYGPRLYRGEDLERAVGVQYGTIYKAIESGNLPKGISVGKRGFAYTLSHVNVAREYFGTLPRRTPGERTITIPMTSLKGGSLKSTTSFILGSCFAHRGYRVLLVDLDPQATLTDYCGIIADWDTDRDSSLAGHIEGDPACPASSVPLLVRNTHLEGLDIIPSAASLADVEMTLSAEMHSAATRQDPEAIYGIFHRVRWLLEDVKQNYDIVLIDGTPALGLLPLNIIFAADTIIVPCAAESVSVCSMGTFFELYRAQLSVLEGFQEQGFVFDDVPPAIVLPTYNAATQRSGTALSADTLDYMRDSFDCLDEPVMEHKAVTSNLLPRQRSPFDVNKADVRALKWESVERARANYAAVADSIEKRIFTRFWPDRL